MAGLSGSGVSGSDRRQVRSRWGGCGLNSTVSAGSGRK